MIEKRIADILRDDATIAAAVGTRVNPVVARLDMGLPQLVYRRLAGEGEYTLAGRAGWRTVTIEVAAWATTYDPARALCDAIRKALDAYEELSGVGSIRFVSVVDGADTYQPDQDLFGCVCVLVVEYDDEAVSL